MKNLNEEGEKKKDTHTQTERESTLLCCCKNKIDKKPPAAGGKINNNNCNTRIINDSIHISMPL